MQNEPTPPVRPQYNGAAQPPAIPDEPPKPELTISPPTNKPQYPTPSPGGLSDEALIEVKLERQKAYQKKREEKRQQRSIKKGFNRSRRIR